MYNRWKLTSTQKKMHFFLLSEIYFIEQTRQRRPKNFWWRIFSNSFYSQGKDDWRYDTIDKFVQRKQEWSQWISQEFGDSVSDAVIFIKKFENIKLAEEHLIRINKECNEKTDNSCGNNCKWIFDEKTKTLFIRGSGKMEDYEMWGKKHQ